MQPSWLHSHTCENPPCGGLFIEHSVLEFFGGVRSVEAEKKTVPNFSALLVLFISSQQQSANALILKIMPKPFVPHFPTVCLCV